MEIQLQDGSVEYGDIVWFVTRGIKNGHHYFSSEECRIQPPKYKEEFVYLVAVKQGEFFRAFRPDTDENVFANQDSAEAKVVGLTLELSLKGLV